LQKLRILIIFLLVSTGLLFADNKSIVIQSANIVIDVLEGTSSVRHLTPYMVDIARNGHLLPEETKSKLESFGFNFSESFVTMTRPNLDFYYDSKNFRIHYDLTGTNAIDPTDSDGDSTPDYIETMATVFEEVYNHDINELGYNPPPSDGTDGGSNDAYDIYVKNLGTSTYAWTYYATLLGDNDNSLEKEYNAYNSYIHMNSNYDGFPSSGLEGIQVTAAHEFFHAIQFGYDGEEELWLMEATAVWMEEEMYNDINDCYQYMVPWFEKPHISLNQSYGLHKYGSFIFFKYIDEHLGGRDMIRKTWEQSRNFNSINGDYSIQSIDLALKSINHTYKKALNNMAIANIIFSTGEAVGQYAYEEAIGYKNFRDHYNRSIQLGIYDSLNFFMGDITNIESYNLQQYGSQYIKINSTDPVRISIKKPVGEDGSINDLTLHTVVKSNSGNYEVQSGPVLNIDPGSNTDWIYAVIVADGNERSNYNYDLSFTEGIKNTNTNFTILRQFPNPFNSTITVKLKVITSQNIDLIVYDFLGRKINTIFSGYLSGGSYEYFWNGVNNHNEKVSSGVYFITAVSDNRQEWKKITLIK
jgi:hypothetical protein